MHLVGILPRLSLLSSLWFLIKNKIEKTGQNPHLKMISTIKSFFIKQSYDCYLANEIKHAELKSTPKTSIGPKVGIIKCRLYELF